MGARGGHNVHRSGLVDKTRLLDTQKRMRDRCEVGGAQGADTMELARRGLVWSVGCIISLFCTTVPVEALANTLQSQAGEQAVRLLITKTGAGPSQMGLYPREEAFVRDVYARLMRYQLAAVEFHGITAGIPRGVQDYLVVRLGKIQTSDGEVGSPIGASDQSGALTLKKTALCNKDDPCHAYYDVEWGAKPGEQPPSDGKVVRYTTYEVGVTLVGRELTYRALVLFHETADSSKVAPEMVDPVISQINEVASDRSPLAIAPWSKYIKTGRYYAVVARVKDRIKTGEALVDPLAPIGFIPGDDVTPEEALWAAMIETRSGDCDCGQCRSWDGTYCVPDTYPPDPPNISGCCNGQRYNSQTSCCIKSWSVQDTHPADGHPETCAATFQSPDWRYQFDGCTWFPDNPAGGIDTSFHNPYCSGISPNFCNGPCDLHDSCYQTCAPTRGHRFCDDLLYNEAMGVCNRSQEPLPVRLYCQQWALEMYVGLAGGLGAPSFWLRQGEVCQCCP